jgi:hypothetical protein
MALSNSRSRPSFLVIGAQKCGTTTLFSCLAAHPDIVPPLTKEIHYFDGGKEPGEDVYEAQGEKWYLAHFPRVTKLMPRGCQTFEASPSYLYVHEAAERIARDLPDARLLVLLRNPVDRAISHYRHNVSKGREVLSFEQALESEYSRMQSSDSWQKSVYAYVDRGFYFKQLVRFQSFRDHGRLLVMDSGFFFRETRLAMRRIYSFLGVSADYEMPVIRARNVGRARATAGAGVYADLQELYRPENAKLWNWLGEDYGWDG